MQPSTLDQLSNPSSLSFKGSIQENTVKVFAHEKLFMCEDNCRFLVFASSGTPVRSACYKKRGKTLLVTVEKAVGAW